MTMSPMRSSAALLAAIFLTVTLAGQAALAQDDNGNGGPTILNVTVDFANEQIVITGERLRRRFSRRDPVVTLGGARLTVVSSTKEVIVADCPLDVPDTGTPLCLPGDFLLGVKLVGGGDDDDDDGGGLKVAYDLTIPAVLLDAATGKIGIGTTDPQSTLEVGGTVAAEAFASTSPLILQAPPEPNVSA